MTAQKDMGELGVSIQCVCQKHTGLETHPVNGLMSWIVIVESWGHKAPLLLLAISLNCNLPCPVLGCQPSYLEQHPVVSMLSYAIIKWEDLQLVLEGDTQTFVRLEKCLFK